MYLTEDKANYLGKITFLEKVIEVVKKEEPNALSVKQEKLLRNVINRAKLCYDFVFVSADEFSKGQKFLLDAKNEILDNILKFQRNISNKDNRLILMFLSTKASEILYGIKCYC